MVMTWSVWTTVEKGNTNVFVLPLMVHGEATKGTHGVGKNPTVGVDNTATGAAVGSNFPLKLLKLYLFSVAVPSGKRFV